MPIFRYLARSTEGKEKKGKIEADNDKSARVKLREQGLYVIEVVLISSNEVRKFVSPSNETRLNTSKKKFLTRKVSNKKVALFTRQLATMIASALPLEEALSAICEQSQSGMINPILNKVRARIQEGYNLSGALREHPNMFDNMYCAMVEAAEASGNLDIILLQLAEHTEQKEKIRQQLIQAMVYPLMLTFVAISVIVLLLTFVVPKIVEQFIHMKQSLPFSTTLLISMSDFLRTYGIYLILLLMTALLIFERSLKKATFELMFHEYLLNMYVVGKLIKEMNSARYARTLAILHASGVSLVDAMKISANVVANKAIKARFIQAAESVKEGETLFQSLSKTNLLSPMMLYMIASGEKSGELDGLLTKAAQTQDDELSMRIKLVLSLFEPLLVLTMAGVVLFIILAIMQPILALNSMFS